MAGGWWAASYVVLWILVILLTILVVALARQVGVLHLRLGPRGALEIDEEGPPLGEAPPPVNGTDTEGRAVTIGGPGQGQLVLFVSPECSLCRTVLPSLPVAARAAGLTPRVVMDAPAAGETDHEVGPDVPVVPDPLLAEAYRIPGTPYVVAIDAAGVVRAKGTVNNLEQMEGLVDTARRRIAGAVPHTLS
ncbi:MAG TPA: methylamine dehydrogenase accessory protein MauD [Actinomycetota bacterium]|nr:methylamine dehydrogenase accessory protein MauD [Actinomycetota bacterium]